MATGKHLSEDEIRYVVDVESSKAQQEIHKLEKSSNDLRTENKRRLDQMIKMEAAGKKSSQQYKDLKKRYNEVNREIRQNTEQIAKLTNGINVNNLTMNQLKKQAKQLQKQLDDTSRSLNPEAYKQLADRLSLVNGRMAELKGTANNLKGMFDSAKGGGIKGFFSSFLSMDGVKAILSGNILLKAGGLIGTAIIEGAKQVFAKAKLFYDFNVEVEEARRLTREFLDVEGKELTEVSSQLSAIAKQTGKDYKEVLSATDTLMNQFDITAREAYEAIKDGIQAGADENGTFLSQIQQYAPAFRDAGISVQDLVALITQTRSGIFNEQGMSLIQTATNRIRTMGTATQKALDDIGISSEQLEQDLVSGDKSIIEAIQLIAARIQELPENSQQVGEVMKDVFGKTASNEGMKMIGTLATISTNMNDLKGITGEYGRLQREQIDTQAELNEKLSDMFGIGQGGFKEMTTKAETFILRGLIKTIDYCRSLYDEIKGVRVAVAAVATVFDTFFKACEWGFYMIIDLVKGTGRALRDIVSMMEGLLTLDFDQVKSSWTRLFDGVVSMGKEIAADSVDVGTRWGNNFIDSINKVTKKNKVNAPEVDGGQLDEVTVTARRGNTNTGTTGGSSGNGGTNRDNADEQAIRRHAAARKEDLEQARRDYQSDVNALNLALAQKRISQEQYDTMMTSRRNTYADQVLAIESDYYARSQELILKDGTKRAELMQQQEQNVYQARQQQFNAQLEAEKRYQMLLQQVVSEGEVKRQLTLEEEQAAKLAVLEGYYQAAIAHARETGQDTAAIEQAAAQARLNIENDYAQKIADREKDAADKRKQQRIQVGVERQNEYQQRLQQLKDALAQELISEQEYEQAVKQLKMESWKDQFDYYSKLFGDAMQALQDAELANVDAKYDAEIEAARRAGKDTAELERKKENEKLKIQKKYADVNFAIKASQIIADTSVAIMKALAELGPVAGPIAAARKGTISTSFYLNDGSFYSKVADVKLKDVFTTDKDTIAFEGTTAEERVAAAVEYCRGLRAGTSDRFAVFPVLVDDDSGLDTGWNYKILNAFGQTETKDTRTGFGGSADTNRQVAVFHPDKAGTGSDWYNAVQRTEYVDTLPITIGPGYYISPFIRAVYVLRRVFTHFGYELQDNLFTQTAPFKDMVMVNNVIDVLVNGRLKVADLLPDITVLELLTLWRRKFCCEFITDESGGTADVVFFGDMAAAAPVADLTRQLTAESTFGYKSEKDYKRIVLSSEEKVGSEVSDSYDDLKSMVADHPQVYFNIYDGCFYKDGYSGNTLMKTKVGECSQDYNTGEDTDVQEVRIADCMPEMRELTYTAADTDGNQVSFSYGTYLYIGGYCTLNSKMQAADTDEEQTTGDSSEHAKPMLAFAYLSGGRPEGTLSAYDVYDGSHPKLWDYSLFYNGDDGIFERFYRPYDLLLRNSLHEVKARLLLTRQQKQDLPAHGKVTIRGQQFLIDKLKFTLGGKDEPQECTLRTAWLMEPVVQAMTLADLLPDISSDYVWVGRSSTMEVTKDAYENAGADKDRIFNTVYPPLPSAAYAGTRYGEQTTVYSTQTRHKTLFRHSKYKYTRLTVWLECVPYAGSGTGYGGRR